jgi:RNA-directed DNA polymerase
VQHGFEVGRELHSAAEPFPPWSSAPYVIKILLLKAEVKHRILCSPTRDYAFELEITFCVRGVVSPLLSNILLTPFDQEMRRKGYQLTRYADDWVATCESAAEARAAVAAALRILNELGVQLHPQKTRVVHVRQGFEFLGYKIKRGKQLRLPPRKIRSGIHAGELYAYPREKSIRHFMDQVRALTGRRVPLKTKELIDELNPVLRGWGQHYKRAHVRKLFHRLDGWIVRRIRSHRFKRWRNGGWRQLPETKLYGEYGLVNLIQLIPSIASRKRESS